MHRKSKCHSGLVAASHNKGFEIDACHRPLFFVPKDTLPSCKCYTSKMSRSMLDPTWHQWEISNYLSNCHKNTLQCLNCPTEFGSPPIGSKKASLVRSLSVFGSSTITGRRNCGSDANVRALGATSARSGGVVKLDRRVSWWFLVFFTKAKIIVYHVYVHIYNLFLYLWIYLLLSTYLSVHLPIYLPISMSPSLFISLSISLFLHISISPCLSIFSCLVLSFLVLSYLMYGIFTLFTYMILQVCSDLASSFHFVVSEASEKRCQKVMPLGCFCLGIWEY